MPPRADRLASLLALIACCLLVTIARAHDDDDASNTNTFSTFSEYEDAVVTGSGNLLQSEHPAVTADLDELVFDVSVDGSASSSSSNSFTPVDGEAAASSTTTKWPEYNPPGPYFFDTLCFGRFSNTCLKSSPYCQWYTSQDPSCYDQRYVSVTVPNPEPVPFHVKFFQFNYGVHLVEGTFFKRFYSISVDECAKLCIKAAGGFDSFPQQKRRCLSFDFYPFETWKSEAPYYESQSRGICALNSDTKNTARMRNEDQGFTDAEYYYRSHCSRRPFNPTDGYYEVRDPRGTLSPLLDYAGPTSLGLESPWGGSRWGMFHPNLPGYLPTSLVDQLQCSLTTSSDSPKGPVFRGGFTPVTDEQHCPGLMTKTEARDLCQERGGSLCKNQADLDAISGRKLGCAFDQAGNGKIWHEGRADSGKMWPRCCASYVMPLSNSPALEESGSFEDSCTPYQKPNIDFCDKFKTVTQCVYSHTPGDKASANPTSWALGSGRGLDNIRKLCLERSKAIPGYKCRQMDVEFWKTATNCIWCPQAGMDPVGGNGQCRAGGDYGVCPSGSTQQRQVFGLRARSTCSEMTNCVLLTKYPDLAPYMGNYTFVKGTDTAWKDMFATPTKKTTAAPSSKPTNWPTDAPTSKPTNYPTTSFPTTSKAPTLRPTLKPTDKTGSLYDSFGSASDNTQQQKVTLTPTALPPPPNAILPTHKPTSKKPTAVPTRKPTAVPTTKKATTNEQPEWVLPDFSANRAYAVVEEQEEVDVVAAEETEENDE